MWACWTSLTGMLLVLQKASVNRRSSPVLLPNRRRLRTPSPQGNPRGSLSPLPSMHDGLAALHEAATSPERQARAFSSALPRHQEAAPTQVSALQAVLYICPLSQLCSSLPDIAGQILPG